MIEVMMVLITWEAPALLPDCSPIVASLPCLQES